MSGLFGSLQLFQDGFPFFLRFLCHLHGRCFSVIDDPVDHAVIILHCHFYILQVILRLQEFRQRDKTDGIHIMTGYLTVGADCYDVADRKAVPTEVCRMRDIEFLIDLIQQCVLILVSSSNVF